MAVTPFGSIIIFGSNGLSHVVNPGAPGTVLSSTGSDTAPEYLPPVDVVQGLFKQLSADAQAFVLLGDITVGGPQTFPVSAAYIFNTATGDAGLSGAADLTQFGGTTEAGICAHIAGNKDTAAILFDTLDGLPTVIIQSYLGSGQSQDGFNLVVTPTLLQASIGSNSLSWDGNLLTINNLRVNNLPTSDPMISGSLWNDSGTVKVSA